MVYKNRHELIQDICEWMQHEDKVGKDVSDQELVDHFHISLSEAQEILNEFDRD